MRSTAAALRPVVRVFQDRFQRDTSLKRHEHSHAYISLVLLGKYYETQRRQECLCERGTLIFHPAGERHDDKFGAETVVLNVEFQELYWNGLTAEQRLTERVILKDVSVSLSHDREALALQLADLVTKEVDTRFLGTPHWLRKASDLLHMQNGPTVREVAAAVGVHPVHLARAFRRSYGCAPTDVRLTAMVERAVSLLRNPKLSISDVALTAGFADQSHLTRILVRFRGFTPAQLRKAL